MTVEDWCDQHGITKAAYYWRPRKAHEAMLEAAGSQISFMEISQPVPAESIPTPAAVLKSGNSLVLEITDQASGEFLTSLLRVMIHAE